MSSLVDVLNVHRHGTSLGDPGAPQDGDEDFDVRNPLLPPHLCDGTVASAAAVAITAAAIADTAASATAAAADALVAAAAIAAAAATNATALLMPPYSI